MGINKVVGLWTWCLALPSEHSWEAAQGSAPVPCFGSLGYLKAYMGLGHHSALLEIETFWVDGSILLSLFMENRLFHDGNLPEILLLYFGSPACKAVWEQKKNLGQELELSREAKIFFVAAEFLCSLPWLVTHFPRTPEVCMSSDWLVSKITGNGSTSFTPGQCLRNSLTSQLCSFQPLWAHPATLYSFQYNSE